MFPTNLDSTKNLRIGGSDHQNLKVVPPNGQKYFLIGPIFRISAIRLVPK